MADTVNPIVTGIKKNQQISDPRLREFYFGSPDYEGILSEGRRAAEAAYGRRFDPRGVAGFSPFANRAMESAYAGIGGYKPYLDFQKNTLLQGMGTIGERRGLLDEATEGYRRAGQMQQPYLSQAEQQYGMGMNDLMSSFGRQGPSARDFQRSSLQGFDPRAAAAYGLPSKVMQPFVDSAREQTAEGLKSLIGGAAREQEMGAKSLEELQRGIGQDQASREAGLRELRGGAEEARMIARETGRSTFDPRDTSRFYDPFEDRVVQQTIDDIMKGGAQQDIAARAGDIKSGGESAFGSRARLNAGERQAALGKGLGEALANIRSGGFQRAQQAALGEFGRQQSALERSGSTLAGLGQQIGSGLDRFGAGQLGASQLLAGQMRGLGTSAADRAAQEQAARFGAAGAETSIGTNLAGLSQQALDTAMRESQFGRGALERAAGFEAGLGRDMLGARRGFAGDMMGLGARRGDIARTAAGDIRGISGDIGGLTRDYTDYGREMGGLGGMYQQMGRDERSELMGFDEAARGMKQRGIDAAYDADERNRFRGMKAVDYMRGFMPQYTPGGTRIDTTYGMPQDPNALGLGAFFNAYSNYGGQYGNQNQNTGNAQTG
jgi:hypothetical protein